MRSWLFVPANCSERIDKAFAIGPDKVIVDLEDAVPRGQKSDGRATVAALLQDAPPEGLALRLNPLDRPEGIEDIRMLMQVPYQPGVVILPKAETPYQVVQFETLLRGAGRPVPSLCPLIESAVGLANAVAILRAGAALTMFGAGDYAADVGADGSWESLAPARARLLEAAAQAGVSAVDSPYFSIRDQAGLEQEISRASAFGFWGKAAIHPAQVPAITFGFTPAPETRDWAVRVLAETGKGASVVDGQMIDEAIARRARRILAAAGVKVGGEGD